ncbi:DUF7736 domain-containing protein [Nocardia asiatica]|uniref:DUF7736 domain-containing protein n=1 Tax=Nocardia asiatica TaxID=209252 RepID=UPI002457CEAF|nr:hypothetical protein [Nocardia asiatica]
MTMKEFHIGDILSVTTGILVSPRHIDGVADILQWMTGDVLWTHQLPRACKECAPALRQQFPDLAAIEVPEGLNSEDKVLGWLSAIEQAHGSIRQVVPLPKDDHTSIDPIAELKMMRPDMPIVPVVADDAEGGA